MKTEPCTDSRKCITAGAILLMLHFFPLLLFLTDFSLQVIHTVRLPDLSGSAGWCVVGAVSR